MIKTIAKFTVLIVLSIFLLLEGIRLLHNIKPVPSVVYSKPSNTVSIEGMIYNRDMGYIQQKFVHMPDKTARLAKMVRAGEDHIYIKIDSPGGLMKEGMDFVYLMRDAKALGVTFTCVIDGNAMSMGLIIFSECDERYAVFGSKLMWHSIATMVMNRMNVQNTSKLLDFMMAKNDVIWADTRLHFYPWYFVEHFTKESILSATEVQDNSIRYLRVIRGHKVQ